MLNRNLNWANFRALEELYQVGHTKAKILNNPFLRTLKDSKRIIRFRTGNTNIIEAAPTYKKFYESNFKESFQRYSGFFRLANLNDDGNRRYDENDIKTLMFVWDNKEELKSKLSTIRRFSAVFFNSSKYLENHPGLRKAVCQILEIEDFPEKVATVNQWRLVVDCRNPKAVVLCENLAFLKQPWEARENNIELWYVGGNNTGIINNISIDKFSYPLYYSCDWDLAGLQIYGRIRKMISEKGSNIRILKPIESATLLPVHSPYHKSVWDSNKIFSGLNVLDFSEEEVSVIKVLISKNQWIEEESQDLMSLLKSNKVL
jgi:hypothetical protein